MTISKRLKAIGDKVRFTTVADIGTDHGYMPIYLLENGKLEKGIACDINKGPLSKAELNIQNRGYHEAIETRLGNGLCKLQPNEVETIVIAGMGGMLIIDILEQGINITKTAKQLVLQPQLDIYSVRKYLHSTGFRIDDEKMVYDEGKYYTILDCSQGDDTPYNEEDYLFGKLLIDRKDSLLKEYLEAQIEKQKRIVTALEGSENNKERLFEVNKDMQMCYNILKTF